VPFAHPHETRDSRFERFAEAAGNFSTRWLFFLIFLLLALAWVWAAVAKHRDLEHVFIGIFTIASLFKIALLANSEKRDLEDLRLRLEAQEEALDALRDGQAAGRR
jgi:low affinity Fe/Cu permease